MQAAVNIRRSVLRDHHALVAAGDFALLFRGWHEHADRWQLKVDGLGEIMMHQGLAGAALQLAFRVPEETTAWTASIHQPQANLFVTGGGTHHTLTGRYFDDGVHETGFNRLFVQRAHPNKEAQRSMLRVEGLDLLDIFEQFFRNSEQLTARFVETGPAGFAMVQGLPGLDPEWLAGLDDAGIAALAGTGEVLDERRFVLHCGCSPDKVAGTLARMFANQAEEFFAGDPVVEALCPRCGARHLLDRKTFDRMVDEL